MMNGEEKIQNDHLRYRLLADASVNAANGMSSNDVIRTALDSAIEALNLVSGSVRVVDENGKLVFIHIAGRSEFSELMRQTEEKMLTVLRDNFSVRSTFLTFESDGIYSLFSYPLKMEDKIHGTISGITPGERSLAVEEDFIKAISAVLALILNNGKISDHASPNDIIKAKAEAVVETAVTINHEINNPLTAVLGNIQLLLLNSDDLNPEIISRLKAVEESALKIKEVTKNLMRIIEPSVVEYTTGLKMVDINKSLKEAEEKLKKEKD